MSYRGEALHERVKYWIRPELQSLIKENRVHGHFHTEVTEITPTAAMLRSSLDHSTTELAVDDVLLQIGYEHDGRLMDSIGIERSGPDRAPTFDQDTMETNVPDVYVAGTAAAGTQDRFRVFIENCHIHAERIAAAMTGNPSPESSVTRALEES